MTVSLPPLFDPVDVTGQADPFQRACAMARAGCDAGTVLYDLGATRLRAALVFAPEVPLRDAVVMLPLCGVGFQNALGALAPPEVGVHLQWDGGLRLNGGLCGQLRIAASGTDPAADIDWLVVALDLALWPQDEDTGHTPDQTALYAEGCADVAPQDLLEAWVRHTLVGLNTWDDAGLASLHRDWSGLAHGMGEGTVVQGLTGTFTGVDERFGLLLKTDQTTALIPLTDLLKEPT